MIVRQLGHMGCSRYAVISACQKWGKERHSMVAVTESCQNTVDHILLCMGLHSDHLCERQNWTMEQ